jgi:hypothetical protein
LCYSFQICEQSASAEQEYLSQGLFVSTRTG